MDKDLKAEDMQTAGFEVRLDDKAAGFYEKEPRVRARVEVAGLTHPGKVRSNNEDNFLAVRRYRGREVLSTSLPYAIPEPAEDHAYSLAIADGMGGRNFGEVASLLAMRTGWELGGVEIKWSMKMNEGEVEEIRRKAEVFFRLIDRTLHDEAREAPELAGMGTTLTICYSTGPVLFVLHAGDSRAYLYRAGRLRQLTRDHNMGQLLVDAGIAEAGSEEELRVRHVLTNVLGGPEGGITVDVQQHQLLDGDLVLLCTDGLTDMAGDEAIARVLAEQAAPEDACRALVDLALEGGGRDNVTVLLARYHFEDEPGRAAGSSTTAPG